MSYFCTNCGNPLQKQAQFCTKCGTEIADGKNPKPKTKTKPNFATKRQKVLAQKTSNIGNNGILYFILAIVGITGFAVLYDSLPAKLNPILEKQPIVAAPFKYPVAPQRMALTTATVNDGKIIFPLDILKKNKFLKFNYSNAGLQVPLLAYLTEEGKVVTAVSMCEPCNSETFHIRGDKFVCNSCGTTWEVDNLIGISGSCQKFPPDAIPSRVVGNEVQIDESIVANWQRRV